MQSQRNFQLQPLNISYSKDNYWVKEKIEFKHDEIYGTVSCGIFDEKYSFGEVEYKIGYAEMKNNKKTWFGYLEVNRKVERRGIGSCLMDIVIENVRIAKEFWNIVDTICLSGWLSSADHKNGNWLNSIPFYINQAYKSNCKYELRINYDENIYSSIEDFFANVGDKDGHIIYWI